MKYPRFGFCVGNFSEISSSVSFFVCEKNLAKVGTSAFSGPERLLLADAAPGCNAAAAGALLAHVDVPWVLFGCVQSVYVCLAYIYVLYLHDLHAHKKQNKVHHHLDASRVCWLSLWRVPLLPSIAVLMLYLRSIGFPDRFRLRRW